MAELSLIDKLVRDAKVKLAFGPNVPGGVKNPKEAVYAVVNQACKDGEVMMQERAYALMIVTVRWFGKCVDKCGVNRENLDAAAAEVLASGKPYADEVAELVGAGFSVEMSVRAVAQKHDDRLTTYWRLVTAELSENPQVVETGKVSGPTACALEAARMSIEDGEKIARAAEEKLLAEYGLRG